MAEERILELLGHKGVDIGAIVEQVIEKPDVIVELIEALKVEQRAVKFSYEKVLRLEGKKGSGAFL